ncbi:hypothetical protein WN944_029182 [Citrus x changshan-huyou]|uniref:CRM domain-containing protein n=1 Tax=Citrus x changshan-huyou TaxID=2935761 RepID=A0AAP0LLV8_9ROSI
MATTMSFLLRPLCISTTSAILSKCQLRKPHLTSIPTRRFFFSHNFSSLTLTPTTVTTKAFSPTLSSQQPQDQQEEREQEPETVFENEFQESETKEEHKTEEEKMTVVVDSEAEEEVKSPSWSPLPLPKLTVKEKKELASYAHSLGKKLKCQLVGKSGVTDGVVTSFIETLEANELLKIKIHRTCPGELEDVVKQLEEATGSVVVSQIGQTVIIYRPSLTRMKLEEKKQQARRVYVRKESKLKPLLLVENNEEKNSFSEFLLTNKKAEVSRLSGRRRRGSSRFSSRASD